jgi:hypothetical protein
MTDRPKSALGPGERCPSLEVLAETPRPPELESHIETCAHCRAELALLHSFENAAPQPDEVAPVQWIESELRRRMSAGALAPPASAWERVRAWLGSTLGGGRQRAWAMVAASVVIVVAAGILLRQDHTIGPPAALQDEVWRSGRFAALSPAGDLTHAPDELRWEPVAAAASYRVQLMEVDRTVIWSADSTATAIPIPAGIRSQLKPGRAFEWQVTAHNAAGEAIASTNLQDFHIAVTIR